MTSYDSNASGFNTMENFVCNLGHSSQEGVSLFVLLTFI